MQVVQYILATFNLSCLQFLRAYVRCNYITFSAKVLNSASLRRHRLYLRFPMSSNAVITV